MFCEVYRPYYPDEELLLPPSLRDWLPEKHPAYFVSDVVDNLGLSAMDALYGNEKRGQPPYDTWMMTKVLVYAYCVGCVQLAPDRAAARRGHCLPGAGGRQSAETIGAIRRLTELVEPPEAAQAA